MKFKNREEAGQKLAENLNSYKNNPNAVVIGLPRGGVVVAFKIAQKLNLPMDITVPRKISDPINPELAIGAITQDGEPVLDKKMIDTLGIEQDYIDKQIEKEKIEAKRRLKLYRAGRTPLDLKNKIVIIVDDGIATGSTMKAAIKSVRSQNAKIIIVATPVAPLEIEEELKKEVDKVVCLQRPVSFLGISQFYDYFPQTEDKEVIELMGKTIEIGKKVY